MISLDAMIRADLKKRGWAKSNFSLGYRRYIKINCNGCGDYFRRLRRVVANLKSRGVAAHQYCPDCQIKRCKRSKYIGYDGGKPVGAS